MNELCLSAFTYMPMPLADACSNLATGNRLGQVYLREALAHLRSLYLNSFNGIYTFLAQYLFINCQDLMNEKGFPLKKDTHMDTMIHANPYIHTRTHIHTHTCVCAHPCVCVY